MIFHPPYAVPTAATEAQLSTIQMGTATSFQP
jgi:hypothetical protein